MEVLPATQEDKCAHDACSFDSWFVKNATLCLFRCPVEAVLPMERRWRRCLTLRRWRTRVVQNSSSITLYTWESLIRAPGLSSVTMALPFARSSLTVVLTCLSPRFTSIPSFSFFILLLIQWSLLTVCRVLCIWYFIRLNCSSSCIMLQYTSMYMNLIGGGEKERV